MLVVLAIITILASLLLPVLSGAKEQARRIKCVSNLRQVAIGARTFALDNEKYPWHLQPASGGTFGSAAGQAWRNFAALSNELQTPQILVCPSDRVTRRDVMQWRDFVLPQNSSNALSYWVGLDSFEQVPGSLLTGDRNIAGGKSDDCGSVSASGVRAREYRTNNTSTRWTNGVHHNLGHIAVNDGSVQRTRKQELQELMTAAYRSLVNSEIRTANGSKPSNHILPPRTGK